MSHIQRALALVFIIGVPAAAAGPALLTTSPGACFTSGSVTYTVATATAQPDYRVRFAEPETGADLRIQMVESPENADFVLVDDDGSPAGGNPCSAASRVKTIRIDAEAPAPDVTVSLSAEPGPFDYRIYVRSARFSHQDAAALLAVVAKMQPRYRLVAHP